MGLSLGAGICAAVWQEAILFYCRPDLRLPRVLNFSKAVVLNVEVPR